MPEALNRTDVQFPSGDAHCAAWLYRPSGGERPPIVILGLGLGGVREMRLDAFSERFAAAGFAALAFDYRHFGASGGTPRQLLDIGRQLEDWAAAIAFARKLDGIDGTKVALWGTSFGGGHVIEAAARDRRVAAVVSQCPFTDGLASLRALGLRSNAQVVALAAADEVVRLARRPPVHAKLIGPPGSAALMTAPDAEPGYRAIMPPDSSFVNGVAARFALHVGLYRPGRSAAKVTCPILFCVCEHDSVAPSGPTLKYAAQAPRGEIHTYPTGHFDIYVGDDFEQAVADQTEFLTRHLLPR
jgi:dienelactone hydrolase